jgi:hypothetical protein
MPAFRDALARRRAEVEKTREGIEALGLPIRKKPTPGTPSHGPAPATTKGSTFDYDVALSFAGEDRAFVEEAAKQLRAANVRVFYDLPICGARTLLTTLPHGVASPPLRDG